MNPHPAPQPDDDPITAAQYIGIMLRACLDGCSLQDMANRGGGIQRLAEVELARRRADGAIGVGLMITPADMAMPKEPRT